MLTVPTYIVWDTVERQIKRKKNIWRRASFLFKLNFLLRGIIDLKMEIQQIMLQLHGKINEHGYESQPFNQIPSCHVSVSINRECYLLKAQIHWNVVWENVEALNGSNLQLFCLLLMLVLCLCKVYLEHWKILHFHHVNLKQTLNWSAIVTVTLVPTRKGTMQFVVGVWWICMCFSLARKFCCNRDHRVSD